MYIAYALICACLVCLVLFGFAFILGRGFLCFCSGFTYQKQCFCWLFLLVWLVSSVHNPYGKESLCLVWFWYVFFFFKKTKGRKHVERSLLAAVFACFTQTCSFLRILNLAIYYCCQMFGLVLGSYVWSFDFDGFNSCLIPRECVWVWSVLHMSVLFCFLSCFLLEFMGARV